MPYTEPAANLMLDALGAVITHLSLHESAVSPGTTGAGEAAGGSPAYARKVPAFSTANDGSLPLTTAVTFDADAGTYRYVGAWNGSTFLAYGQMPVDRVLAGQDTVVINEFTPTVSYEA